MLYFRLKNFETFQHYKDRNPPWIKLHRSLLDDYEFTKLPDQTKAHLMLIWVLGSQLGGRIPDDAVFVASKIGARKLPDLGSLSAAGWLIPEPVPEPGAVQPPEDLFLRSTEQNASDSLAPCKQDASNVLALARSREERRITTESEERRARATLLPNDAHRTLAKELGVDCDFQWGKFCDHQWKGKEPKDKNRAFRNWLRNAYEFAKRDGKLSEERPLDWGQVV